MFFHLIATLSGDRKKSLSNRSEDEILALVAQFERDGTISANWGAKVQTYQVLELRVYQTSQRWHRPAGSLDSFLGKGKRNVYDKYAKRAKKLLGRQTHRVFIVMPIQGEKFGSMDEQRIYAEYDKRFETLEKLLGKKDCVAIRIDKEVPLESLVGRIKEEINRAKFIVADLTDERPSCYFEVGYAEALKKPVIYVASKDSVVNPKLPTKIHFDIHQNVNFFTNHGQLIEKLTAALEKNQDVLFSAPKEQPLAVANAGE